MTKYEFDDLACIDDDFACRDDDFACIDDDWACIDDDDAVCDDERDGLTEEEADAYEKEKAWYDLFKEVLQYPYSYGLSWGIVLAYRQPIKYQNYEVRRVADEKKILKMYNDLTPNGKHLVGVFVNAMILSRNKNDRQSGNSITVK